MRISSGLVSAGEPSLNGGRWFVTRDRWDSLWNVFVRSQGYAAGVRVEGTCTRANKNVCVGCDLHQGKFFLGRHRESKKFATENMPPHH